MFCLGSGERAIDWDLRVLQPAGRLALAALFLFSFLCKPALLTAINVDVSAQVFAALATASFLSAINAGS